MSVTAEVEINYEKGKKLIKMQLKESFDLEECEVGNVIMLNLKDDQVYTGIFKGIDSSTIILGSINGGRSLGLELNWITNYFEEIKEELKN